MKEDQEKFIIIRECKSKFICVYLLFILYYLLYFRIYSCLFSLDDNYVYSGSDDTNIRCWKTESSKPMKLMSIREQTASNYRKKLLEKFKYNPDVKRISRKRNLPKYIVNKQKVRHIQKESKFRKHKNMEMNSKIGTVVQTVEKKDKISKTGVIDN